jgi:hypothetical protein
MKGKETAMRFQWPIERFDPHLRDLVYWGLVERRGTNAKAPWQLVPEAQRRLDELQAFTVPDAAADVYLDHRCADCSRRGLTRLHGDSFVCDTCWSERQARLRVVDPGPSPREFELHFWRRRRSGQALTS